MNNKKTSRKFLGKTEGFTDKQEKRFEQAHLRGYLSGHPLFQYGFKDGINGRVPAYHEVKQEIINL